jgi:hypothetical protein
MDKVQETSRSQCYIPSSKPFRIQLYNKELHVSYSSQNIVHKEGDMGGCIGGTRIETDTPAGNEADCVDQYGNYPINVMVECDRD